MIGASPVLGDLLALVVLAGALLNGMGQKCRQHNPQNTRVSRGCADADRVANQLEDRRPDRRRQ